MDTPQRCLVVWFPGWPAIAWALAEGSPSRPRQRLADCVAVLGAGRIIACTAAAGAAGVAAGQRRREAQARCPELLLVPADEARDAREFAPVLAAVEELAPGVEVVRPGTCVLRSRGLAGYLGDEAEAAEVLLEAVANLGVPGARVGIADGLFTAEQAARAGDPVQVVAAGESARFLAPLPVSRLGEETLATLLPRLGVHTLGDFAALDPSGVRDRFGALGQRLQALAAGADPHAVQPRVPPRELACELFFEPALTLVDQVAFAARKTAEEFVDGLAVAGLACTEVRVELAGDLDELLARTWAHPTLFDAAAVVDRVRWQLQAAAGQLRSGIVALRLEPVAVDALAHHVPGLFGLGPDERVHHALSRVQAMLGHDHVLSPRIAGGRRLAERQRLLPWGDRPATLAPVTQPWPGRVPEPLPATVFPSPLPVGLLDAGGDTVVVDERGVPSGAPATLVTAGGPRRIAAWAGPWPLLERPWDPVRSSLLSRYQVLDEDQNGWLLVGDGTGWQAEARYD